MSVNASAASRWREYVPRSIAALRSYNTRTALADLFAGVTVGVVALPLAMAFAIASGVGPERGLYTAVVAGFLISALGGSRVQIGGPTGAFVVIVYDIVLRHGYDGLATATLMAGFILLVMGFARFGTMIKYIPYPVTTGFTSGIAVIIFSSQIKDFFGLPIEQVPAGFIEKWTAYSAHLFDMRLPTAAIGLLTLMILVLLRRHAPRLPGALIAIVAASLVVGLAGLPVETIGMRFGEMPHMLPKPGIPEFSFAKAQLLVPEAFTIAILAAIESLLSAVVADGMSGDRHSSNCELVAQGTANIASIVFGGIPATGAIARTATNIKAGAQTPVAGVVHALTLLVIMIVAAPLASRIPLASLAAVLFVVAWNMSEIDHFRYLMRAPRSDVAVLLSSFLLTVLVDLTVAVEVGIVLAALLFMKRMSEVGTDVIDTPIVAEHQHQFLVQNEIDGLSSSDVPPGVEIFEINGPFFFGVADKLKHTLDIIEVTPPVFILRMRKVPVIDATGLHSLREFHLACKRQGVVLILSGVHGQVAKSLRRIGLAAEIGLENVRPNIDSALRRARELLEEIAGRAQHPPA